MPSAVVVSCEHGGNTVPRRYAHLFASAGRVLSSHRGYDAGALDLARELARRLRAPLVASRTTRLLVELNRSPHHPRLFSEFSRSLGPDERALVLERYYVPFRTELDGRIARLVGDGRRVVHLSVHSFTPRLRGVTRTADVGLLYDPARRLEVSFCKAIQLKIRAVRPRIVVRRNYPYRGNTDGLTTYLRSRFPRSAYLGIELEVNQKHMKRNGARGGEVRRAVLGALCGELAGSEE
ncbi:MAG: N-formylglutamate amidohydrolase [Gemmatimonadales bacterium]|jgi:predicted N-formylglutamate amidohydrolase|nr:MAG: N-formylglutamate amidohydrolase [Gemmatimonadales bacterium]